MQSRVQYKAAPFQDYLLTESVPLLFCNHPSSQCHAHKVTFELSATKTPEWPFYPMKNFLKKSQIHLINLYPQHQVFLQYTPFSLNTLDNFQSSFHKYPYWTRGVPPTPNLKTLLTTPPEKHLHIDFKMPPMDPSSISQLWNYPGDTLLYRHNQSSYQHMAEDVTIMPLQAQHQT